MEKVCECVYYPYEAFRFYDTAAMRLCAEYFIVIGRDVRDQTIK